MLEGVRVSFELIKLWREWGGFDGMTVVWKPFVMLGNLYTTWYQANLSTAEVCCTVGSMGGKYPNVGFIQGNWRSGVEEPGSVANGASWQPSWPLALGEIVGVI